MSIRFAKSRTTDFRPPPSAGAASPLERDARPGAAACPDRGDIHATVAASYSDETLAAVIEDASRRNLRDYSNHETRWLAERASACRAERRRRKNLRKTSA